MCNDWFMCNLGTFSRVDPTGPQGGTGRVVRGGCSVCNVADSAGGWLKSAAGDFQLIKGVP
jgi:hypothetical protein